MLVNECHPIHENTLALHMDVLNILIHAKISSGEVREPHDNASNLDAKLFKLLAKTRWEKDGRHLRPHLHTLCVSTIILDT